MRFLLRLLILVVLAGIGFRFLTEPASPYAEAASRAGAFLTRLSLTAAEVLAGELRGLPAPFATIAAILAWMIVAGIIIGCVIGLIRTVLWLLREIREAID